MVNRRLSVFSLLGFLAISACRSMSPVEPTYVELQDAHELLRLPGSRVTALVASSDGALFVAAPGTIYMRHLDGEGAWDSVSVPARLVLDMYASSADKLWIVDDFGRLQAWTPTAGWIEVPLPMAPVGAISPDCPPITLWGRGDQHVIAVGYCDRVHAFDGLNWSVDSTPLRDLISDPTRYYEANHHAVAGNHQRTFLGGIHVLYSDSGGPWRIIDEESETTSCTASGLAWSGQKLFAGGGPIPCVKSYDGRTWRVVASRVEGFRDEIHRGRSQPDGAGLFWSYTGEIAEIRCERLRTYILPPFSEFSGAASVDCKLVVGGSRDGAGVVYSFQSAQGGSGCGGC